jgi:hypothetical protein
MMCKVAAVALFVCADVMLGFCGISVAQEMTPLEPSPAVAASINKLATKMSKDIAKNHIASVVVLGGVGPVGGPTRFEDTVARVLNESLAAQNGQLKVVDRSAVRVFLAQQRVSEPMLETDVLADWIAERLNAQSYVVAQFKSIEGNQAVLLAKLFAEQEDEGKYLASEKIKLILSEEERRAASQQLTDRIPSVPAAARNLQCLICNKPDYSELGGRVLSKARWRFRFSCRRRVKRRIFWSLNRSVADWMRRRSRLCKAGR